MSSLPIIGPKTSEETPYLNKLKQLFTMLPHKKYHGKSELNVKIPFNELSNDEIVAGWNNVKEAMGEDAKITFNAGICTLPAINIPFHVVNALDEEGAKRLVDALTPSVHLNSSIQQNKQFLTDALGIDHVTRLQYTDKPHRPMTYEFTFPRKPKISDICKPSVARIFNRALGEELFTSCVMEHSRGQKTRYVKVLISESNVERLRCNENVWKLKDVLTSFREGQEGDPQKNPRDSLRNRLRKGSRNTKDHV